MVVRPATREDAESVFEMLGDFVTSYAPERAAFDRSYATIVSRQDGSLLVAEDARGVVGISLQPT